MAGPMTESMYYVLLALAHPAHGYALMQQIKQISRGRVLIGPGTLYGLLSRMQADGWMHIFRRTVSVGRERSAAHISQGRGQMTCVDGADLLC